MKNRNHHSTDSEGEEYKVWFFAGGETRNDRFNTFTGSFIRLMSQILDDDFEFIKGIYFRSDMMNVIWALNNAQIPLTNPEDHRITSAAFDQMISAELTPDTQLVITSSSSGTIVAAQTACYLAEKNMNNVYFQKPFHLVLGASMISTDSDLYKQLLHYQNKGIIGTILHDEIQDEGDNVVGVGGKTRIEAYLNAFQLMCPWFSMKYKGPSFLNTDPEKGHIHRRRSKTVKKALDYIDIILIKHKLAGDFYMEKAIAVLDREKI
jgi:hypothetical protein